MPADIQLAWAHVLPSAQHLLEAVVSPALLVIAQVPPTPTCYFSSKNQFYFSQAHFSDISVDYDIIMRHKKVKKYIFKDRLVMTFTEIR